MTGLLESTVYLSVTALAVLLFKWIFKNKLSAKGHVLIWALLALRLVLPSLPESSLSIFNAIDIPDSEAQVQEEAKETDGDLSFVVPDVNDSPTPDVKPSQDEAVRDDAEGLSPVVPDYAQQGQDAPKIQAEKTNTGVIIRNAVYTGSLVIFLYFVFIYVICIRKNSGKPRLKDAETLALLEECKKKVGVKRRVYIVNDGDNPMLMGLFKPTIILPDGYTEPEMKNILIHELCHLKSGDIYLLWLAMIVLCLNWYNPIMWVCFFAFRRDVEVYCDERVLRYIDSKKDYAALLVKTALRKNSFIAGTTSLQNGEKEVERRVKYMAYFKKPHYTWTIVIVLIAVLIGVLFLTNPVGDEQGERDVPETETLGENEVKAENKNEENAVKAESENAEQEFSLTYDGFTFKQDTRTEEITTYFPTSERWEEPQNYVFVAGSIEHRRISLYYPSYHTPRIRITCIQNLQTGDSFIERIVVYDEEAVTVTGGEKVKSYKEEYGLGTVYELCVDSPESKEIDAYLNSILDEPTPAPVPEQAPVQTPEQEAPPVTENQEVFDVGTTDNTVSEETQLPEAEPVPEETEITELPETTDTTETTQPIETTQPTDTTETTVMTEAESPEKDGELHNEITIESDFIW